MIEKMITTFKTHLPLKIMEVSWDGNILVLSGQDWGFGTMSAWRLSAKDRVFLGCYDNEDDLSFLVGHEIIDAGIQTDRLKIDPIFYLSTGHILEVFSTDTYEPWTFGFDKEGLYVATPADPHLFDVKDRP